MNVRGQALAQHIREQVQKDIQALKRSVTLDVFVGDHSLATEKFIAIKKKVAEELGVFVVEHDIDASLGTEALVQKIKERAEHCDGIIVQFPLPASLDADRVRNAIPKTHDVDVVSDDAYELFRQGGVVKPPVVGACEAVLAHHHISLEGRRVVVVGQGRLVGKPAAVWARQQGGDVVVVDKGTKNMQQITQNADALILGAGAPGIITPDMIHEGVVILDAGTSEAGGKLAGDADQACAEKAALFTPVPGGIGPIAVAMIFRNLLMLIKKQ